MNDKCGHPIIWADYWWTIASCQKRAGHDGLHGNAAASWDCGLMCHHTLIWV